MGLLRWAPQQTVGTSRALAGWAMDATLSSFDDVYKSVGVLWCVSIGEMPKPARHKLTLVCGANFDGPHDRRTGTSSVPVGWTMDIYRHLLMLHIPRHMSCDLFR